MENDIIKNLNQQMDDVLERGKKLLEEEDLDQHLKDLGGRSKELIRKYPIRSLVAGLFAGYLLAKLISSED